MKYLIVLIGLLMSLCACASGLKPPPRPKLPYDSWYIGLAAPKHMEIWVEDVDVLDQRGLAFFHVFGGVASYAGKVKGWHEGEENLNQLTMSIYLTEFTCAGNHW
jgi:hypothetical protein